MKQVKYFYAKKKKKNGIDEATISLQTPESFRHEAIQLLLLLLLFEAIV
jgi:hypothetical protein